MYSIFQELCSIKGVTPYKVGKETGIATSTLSDWKKGKSTPKQDKLKLIADYFQVGLDYFMPQSETTDKYSDENARLVAKIRNDAALSSALQKYFGFSDVKKKHVIELINLLNE